MARPPRPRLAGVLLAALLAASLAPALELRPEPARSAGLTDLDGPAALRARFEADRGTTRILLLLSPT